MKIQPQNLILGKVTRPILILAAILSLNAGAHAQNVQTIYGNAITATNPSAENPFNTGEFTDFPAVVDLTASTLTRGSGLSAASAGNRFSASNFGSATTLDLTKYFEFTVAPTAGNTLDLSALNITYQISSTGPKSYTLRSSTNGFTTFTDVTTGTLSNTAAAIALSFDLTSSDYDAVSSAISFRLYEYNAGATPGTSSINDFAFPNAPVPEPATVCGGLLAVGLLGWSQRRKLRGLALTGKTA